MRPIVPPHAWGSSIFQTTLKSKDNEKKRVPCLSLEPRLKRLSCSILCMSHPLVPRFPSFLRVFYLKSYFTCLMDGCRCGLGKTSGWLEVQPSSNPHFSILLAWLHQILMWNSNLHVYMLFNRITIQHRALADQTTTTNIILLFRSPRDLYVPFYVERFSILLTSNDPNLSLTGLSNI